ncbi:MAG TPA: universal stress protein [Terriglobia bacterium]|nr:universal stress protein [Terriglobia bacterium]
MLSRTLIATDGSEASSHVLECIQGLRSVGSQEAVLVHVFDVRTVGGLYNNLKEAMLPKLKAQQAFMEKAGVRTTLETPLGIPFYEINKLAREKSSSLIVVGSHGESLLAETLLGSTAHAVLQNAILPVLLIRIEITSGPNGERCRAACHDLFRHILFPTDFSDTAERAFLYLEHIIGQTKSSVTLLHVQDQTRIEKHLRHRLEEFNEIDSERLERTRQRLMQCGAESVELEIPYGSPTALILNRARNGLFSLVMMGSQGRGFFEEVFLGSVSHSVARLAPLPVLFIPAVR